MFPTGLPSPVNVHFCASSPMKGTSGLYCRHPCAQLQPEEGRQSRYQGPFSMCAMQCVQNVLMTLKSHCLHFAHYPETFSGALIEVQVQAKYSFSRLISHSSPAPEPLLLRLVQSQFPKCTRVFHSPTLAPTTVRPQCPSPLFLMVQPLPRSSLSSWMRPPRVF